jgi:hypothetical protein
MNIRVDDKHRAEFTALAKKNKRSLSKEACVAIENHLKANRDALKTGPKLESAR